MLLAPLIIVVAGIARITSRIVRGGGSGETCGQSSGAHTPSKNPRWDSRYKHILLIFVVLTFYELRFYGVLGSSLSSDAAPA